MCVALKFASRPVWDTLVYLIKQNLSRRMEGRQQRSRSVMFRLWNFGYTKMCRILNCVRRRRRGETRAANTTKGAIFTHFLIQKSTLLSRPGAFCVCKLIGPLMQGELAQWKHKLPPNLAPAPPSLVMLPFSHQWPPPQSQKSPPLAPDRFCCSCTSVGPIGGKGWWATFFWVGSRRIGCEISARSGEPNA